MQIDADHAQVMIGIRSATVTIGTIGTTVGRRTGPSFATTLKIGQRNASLGVRVARINTGQREIFILLFKKRSPRQVGRNKHYWIS